jgi:hypothetical protein
MHLRRTLQFGKGDTNSNGGSFDLVLSNNRSTIYRNQILPCRNHLETVTVTKVHSTSRHVVDSKLHGYCLYFGISYLHFSHASLGSVRSLSHLFKIECGSFLRVSLVAFLGPASAGRYLSLCDETNISGASTD